MTAKWLLGQIKETSAKAGILDVKKIKIVTAEGLNNFNIDNEHI